MPNNDIKNTINPKKKVSYDDIKKIVEEGSENKHLEHNIKNKSKKLLNKNSKKSYRLFTFQKKLV